MQAAQRARTVWEYEQDKTNMRILKLGYVKFPRLKMGSARCKVSVLSYDTMSGFVVVGVWTVPS